MMQPPVPGQNDTISSNGFGMGTPGGLMGSHSPKIPKMTDSGFGSDLTGQDGMETPKVRSASPNLGGQTATNTPKPFDAGQQNMPGYSSGVTLGNVISHYNKPAWDNMTPAGQTQMHQLPVHDDVVKTLPNWPPSGSGYTLGQPVTAGHVIAHINNPLWNSLDDQTKATAHAAVLDSSIVKNLQDWPPKDTKMPNADLNGMKLAMGESTSNQPGGLVQTDVGYGSSFGLSPTMPATTAGRTLKGEVQQFAVRPGVDQASSGTASHTGRVKLYYTDATGWNYSPPGNILPYWGRFAGHVALGVDGTVFNYSPDGIAQINEKDYINNVTNADGKRSSPGQTVYVWNGNTTPDETERLKIDLPKNPGAYNVFQNKTCATQSEDSLVRGTAGDIQYSRPFLNTPNEVIDDLYKRNRIGRVPSEVHEAKDRSIFNAHKEWGIVPF